ncbi:hypothetical protein [Novosphingobium huizhouense]|uniref:hypothetical protein n=1 Tax=Novosphingobium huizhouense TaxID=2866625 RepID=UPI001CD81BFB|nr:hypothetical protein [Novosphingobium huizhouense]
MRVGPWLGLVALAALAGAQTASAQSCLADARAGELVRSGRLVEFETLMMAVSLRCARAGVDLRPVYEGMVAANGARFTSAHAAVQQLFGAERGTGYDRYMTQVANRYGGGATDPQKCAMFRTVAATLSNPAADLRALPAVAEAMVSAPILRELICTTGR